MSMSKKIFAIVFLLAAVAIIIMCLGLYSINALNSQFTTFSLQAQRSIAMNRMDRIAVERQLAINQIILESDAVSINEANQRMQATEPNFDAAVKMYFDNMPDPAPAQLLGYGNNIKRLWENFVKISDESGQLGVRNTNNTAMALNENLQSFWDGMDTQMEELAVLAGNSDDAAATRYAPIIRNTRVDLAFFRINLNKFMNSTTDDTIKNYENIMMGYVTRIDEAVRDAMNNLPASAGGDLARKIANDLDQTGKKGLGEIIPLVRENTNGRALQLFRSSGRAAQIELDNYTNELMDVADRGMTDLIASATAMGRFINILMIVISAIGIVIGLILAYFTISSIIKGLNHIIQGLGISSAEVFSASGQISASSQSLAEGSTEQAASLEETSSALEEMASMTRQNADNATKTNDTTKHNDELIGDGAVAVENMSKAMDEISDSAEKISNIIKTIEEIAFNTNLLALNAAVEAARAGEAGKGFAVVADEVRNLAQRSAQAARDTTSLIQGTVDRVKNGSAISRQLETSFKEIQEGSATVGRLIAEITSATNEQAQGVDQVNTAVAQMDKVTQQNAATAEESASAAEELSAQAANLNDMVQNLIGVVEGSRRSSAAPKQQPAGGGAKVKAVKVTNVHDAASKHSATPTSKSSGVKMLPASEVIPLGDDDDF